MVDQIVMENELRVPGGIVIMCKPHINVKVCKKVINQADDHYALAFTVMVQDTIVVGVYSSPKCSLSYIKNCIGQALAGFETFPRIIIGGDFNQQNDLCFLIDNGFKNLVTLPTTKWMTRIDHLYANFETDILTWVNPCYFSDHHSIVTILGNNVFPCNAQLQSDEYMDFTEDINECLMFTDESKQAQELHTETLTYPKNPIDTHFCFENEIQSVNNMHRLENSWNTCWLNCIFQVLWTIIASDNNFSLSSNADISSCIYNWIFERSNRISQTFNLLSEKISDLSLKKAFLISINKSDEVHMKSQEDVLESFQEFVSQCDDLSSLRHSQLETYRCLACESQQTNILTETILLIPIEEKFVIHGMFDLGQAIQSVFVKDENSAKVCENSGCKFQCVKTLKIAGRPRYLIVNVNRAGVNNKKNNIPCIL